MWIIKDEWLYRKEIEKVGRVKCTYILIIYVLTSTVECLKVTCLLFVYLILNSIYFWSKVYSPLWTSDFVSS